MRLCCCIDRYTYIECIREVDLRLFEVADSISIRIRIVGICAVYTSLVGVSETISIRIGTIRRRSTIGSAEGIRTTNHLVVIADAVSVRVGVPDVGTVEILVAIVQTIAIPVRKRLSKKCEGEDD